MKESPGSLGSLRARNRLRIIDVLRQAGSASRVDLVRDTGLSRTTVSKLVAELQADGLVVEREHGPNGSGGVSPADEGAGSGAVGRPPVALTLNPAAGAAVGIDFGHDLVRVAVADLSGAVIAEARDRIDVDSRAAEAIALAAKMVGKQLAGLHLDLDRTVGVGVAVSAPILRELGDPGATSILPGWGPFAPGGELEKRFGRPVLMGNDANLGALAEVRHGAGRGARNVVYVMLSGGIGAGLILDGALFLGHSGLTGELGHVVADPAGRICRCGNRGCLETVAGARALTAPLAPVLGAGTSVADVVDAADEGNAGARRVLADAGTAVGRALLPVCTVLDPALVVLGGDCAGSEALLQAVRDVLARELTPLRREAVPVVTGTLGEDAETLGAVALASRRLGH